MAVIVVGGSGKDAGKTSLVCGLLAALPELAWVAVKVTGHGHGKPQPIWEETVPGSGTDTARYLAAGASRAFLITARDEELAAALQALRSMLAPDTNILFESNRTPGHLHPDLCLAISRGEPMDDKPSFHALAGAMDARVIPGQQDYFERGATPVFSLVALDRVSPEMQNWIRQQLARL